MQIQSTLRTRILRIFPLLQLFITQTTLWGSHSRTREFVGKEKEEEEEEEEEEGPTPSPPFEQADRTA
ncbi:hypothetical protein ACTXT7_001817 [Hymenolepis weldensis]